MPKRTATINHPSSSTNKSDTKAEANNVEEEKVKLSDLRDLVYLGRCEKVVNIKGYKFSLKTLTASEQRQMLKKVMSDSAGSILDAKPITLSYSVMTINGVHPSALYEGIEELSDQEMSLHVFMNMQATLIDALYREYESLLESSNKEIEIDDLKA